MGEDAETSELPPPQDASECRPHSPPLPPDEESALRTLGSEEPAAASSLPDAVSPESKPVLTDELRDKIIRQVEYYFGDENLPTDKFLLKHVKKNKEGFVPIGLIASFRKMKKLCPDILLIEAALKASSHLVISSDGKRVRRLHPLPDTDIKDGMSRTVLVENLPEDHSSENIQRICGGVGIIKNISVRDPHGAQELTKANKADMVISAKLHALVEYDTVEAAQKAVETLNDEKNWRIGMRVELLLKRMGKYGLVPRVQKGAVSAKSVELPATDDTSIEEQESRSTEHPAEAPSEEEEHVSRNKRGRRRNQGRKGHQQNGHGHGSAAAAAGHEALSKPPPGPKMPDGTRGFTMGRGRPLST
ncbi:la-related protein 6A [Aristolochia californica]|uniref:la-related protein 6A n=1 Tax=Aristolochia californica TaxID=171875 RepID=UPI0035DFE767